MISNRILTLVWAVFLAFLSTSWLGSTHILSGIFHIDNIVFAANVFFVVTSILFALVIYFALPPTMSGKIKVMAFLPPVLFFSFFFFDLL